MSSENEPLDTSEARLERRIADLYASDPEFAAARPDASVGAAVEGLRLPDVVRTVVSRTGRVRVTSRVSLRVPSWEPSRS